MSSESRAGRAGASLVALLLLSAGAGADGGQVRLAAEPETCVALHRDQVCYRRVALSWSGLERGARYCLERRGVEAPLVCWDGGELGSHRHDYASAEREEYRLVIEGGDEVLATATVTTAWVYRRRRGGAAGWRLF